MSAAFDDFVAIIARLRAPDGCPWDRAQTPQTLRRYLLEEAYEALEAIDLDDAQRLKEELGDILLQIVLQSQIASETGAFTLDGVIANIHAKIIRRHPHVFGDQQGASVEQIEENWEQIKRAEKKPGAQVSSFLGDIPKGLPALAESEDMQQRAWRVGLWNGAPSDAERATFHALSAWHARLDAVSLGDALFRLVDRARREGLDAEGALRQANQRFAKSLQQSVPAIDAPDTSPPKTQEQTQ
jgi:tetrapyrrole methylase family protein / MazG family protein